MVEAVPVYQVSAYMYLGLKNIIRKWCQTQRTVKYRIVHHGLLQQGVQQPPNT